MVHEVVGSTSSTQHKSVNQMELVRCTAVGVQVAIKGQLIKIKIPGRPVYTGGAGCPPRTLISLS